MQSRAWLAVTSRSSRQSQRSNIQYVICPDIIEQVNPGSKIRLPNVSQIWSLIGSPAECTWSQSVMLSEKRNTALPAKPRWLHVVETSTWPEQLDHFSICCTTHHQELIIRRREESIKPPQYLCLLSRWTSTIPEDLTFPHKLAVGYSLLLIISLII